jgi:hypothetical protein
MVLANLLQSCGSVRHVIETIEIYTLVCGKTFFGYRARFSPVNLLEPLCVVVGDNMSSFRERSSRPRGIVGTWKQAVTQLFLRKFFPANHQKDRLSGSGSFQTNNILAFPPFYY